MKSLLWMIFLILNSTAASYSQLSVPTSIDGTGESDVSVELNDFFGAAPDNSVIIFPEDKVYRIESTLRIKEKKNLTVIGNGSVLVAETTGEGVPPPHGRPSHNWPRNREHLRVESSTGINISQFRIKGAHDSAGVSKNAYVEALEAQHGITIYNSRNVVLDSLRITNVYGDCVYIGDGSGRTSSDSVTIRNCFLGFTGRQGIAITSASTILIYNCEFTDVRRSHIDLEGNSPQASISNIVIKENIFHSSRLNWFSAAGKGITKDVYVINNRLIDMGAKVTVGNDSHTGFSSFYFIGNKSNKPVGNPGGGAWKLINVQSFYAEGNVIPVQKKRRMYLVRERNSINIIMKNNFVPDGLGSLKPR